VAQRREVDAPQAGVGHTRELSGRRRGVPHRQVGEPDVARGLDRAAVGQPLVVDAYSHGREFGVEGEARVVAQQLREERDGLEVLAAVEDHFGGDAITVHVAEPRVNVGVPRGQLVGMRGEPGRGHGPSGARRIMARHEVVERVEVPSRAVAPQLRAEERPDVGVG